MSALCAELKSAAIDYCHWKSNIALDRSAAGKNDLDLLISNQHAGTFQGIVSRLGFKHVETPTRQRLPGVTDYYGCDAETGTLIHLHVHFRLILGDDHTKNYRLPIEHPFLASGGERHGFRIPAPEFELITFVVRMVLKHCSWDAILGRKGRLSAAERAEQAWLVSLADRRRLDDLLVQHVPLVGSVLFGMCLEALHANASVRSRVIAAWRLQTAFAAQTRRSAAENVLLKACRRLGRLIGRRLDRPVARRRPTTGGFVVAIVGGDGAGKSTVIDAATRWLGPHLTVMRMHMGKPRWSWTTWLVRASLKVGKLLGLCRYVVAAEGQQAASAAPSEFPGYALLVREVCLARDRYRANVRARRFANNGGIVVSDRYPLAEIGAMDGPRVDKLTKGLPVKRLVRVLSRLERFYYRAIGPPDLLVILRVDPETAVARKSDEDADFVRARSNAIWRLDCSGLNAIPVDAGRNKEAVISEVKQLIWSAV